MTSGDGPLPPPLPVRVRPVAGETAGSYVSRLARANHLRPSLLHVYLRGYRLSGGIPLRRLAAISGSTQTALTSALSGLPVAARRQDPFPDRLPAPAESQADRKARLFALIRDDVRSGLSIRQTALRHHVHRRMVRQALSTPAAPPPRKQPERKSQVTGPIKEVLDELARTALTARAIWATLIDEYNSDASYSVIRGYVSACRSITQPTLPASDEGWIN